MARKNILQKSNFSTGQADRCSVFSIDEQRVRLAKESMPSLEVADEIAAAFKVLSHPSRVRILRALSSGELCVCELSAVIGLSVSATSHQLSLLKSQHLVCSRSDGKLVHYSLGDRFVLALLEDCAKHVGAEGAII